MLIISYLEQNETKTPYYSPFVTSSDNIFEFIEGTLRDTRLISQKIDATWLTRDNEVTCEINL